MSDDRFSIDVHLPPDHRRAAMAADAEAGLTATPKTLPPVWFYDERGSVLFDEITRLPEYYPTRAERSILATYADEIVELASAPVLVELGSGTSDKTRLLLDAMAAAGRLHGFVPFDVSEETLRQAAAAITDTYDIPVHAIVGDFHRHLGTIPRGERRIVAFLGSTIGNLDPAQRRRFYFDLDTALDYDDWLLLGTDLVKDEARLVAAYDDAAGVTAEFNRNVLGVLNRELGAHFDLETFAHVARWNRDDRWIEMRLRSRAEQLVAIDDLALKVSFTEGEEVLTEIAAKFTLEQVREELWESGFVVERSWTDVDGDFLLTLAHPYC
ncbi:MAG: L-histidine N(alpha)-methyltransferase [Acidimicrobiia bacterium]